MLTKTVSVFSLLVCTRLLLAQPPVSIPGVPSPIPRRATLDKPVQDFELKNILHKSKKAPENESLSLSSFKEKKVILLFFLSDHCTTSQAYTKPVRDLCAKEEYKKSVALVGVRCSASDTEEGMRQWAETEKLDFPILNDLNGKMTTYFKVRTTPTFIVIDTKGVMRYRGSFNDDPDPKLATKQFVADALDAIRHKREVPAKENAPFGCIVAPIADSSKP